MMRWAGLLFVLAAPVAVIVAAVGPVAAAEDDPRVVIALKEADERLQALAPKGVPVGGMMLHGGMDVRLSYDDNVVAAPHPVPDTVLTLAPALTLHSGPHPWDVKAWVGAEDVRHADHAAFDHRDLRAGARVSGESWDRSRAHLGAEWSRRHELPGTIETRGAAALPVPVDRLGTDGAVLLRQGRFLLGGTAILTRLRYRDVAAIGGGMIDQRHRDRVEMMTRQRAGVAPTSMLDLFVETAQGVRLYERPTPVLGIDRSSQSADLSIGAALDMTERMAGEIVWGRSRRQYANPLFAPLSETVYRGRVAVSLTTLTALTGRVWRSVEETGAVLQAAAIDSGWRLGLEHELLRQLVLKADGGVTRRRYVGLAGDLREEDVVVHGNAEYRIDHRWFIGLDGRWDDRASTVPGGAFTRTRFTLVMGARL